MATSHNSNTKKIYRNSNGCIGSFEVGSGTLRKEIYGSKGMLRNPLALCFDFDLVTQVEGRLKVLVVHDRETDQVYTATANVFEEHRFPVNRGQGKQWGLRLSHFQVGEATHQVEDIGIPETLATCGICRQLNFFEEGKI